jgi:hypothetical protein
MAANANWRPFSLPDRGSPDPQRTASKNALYIQKLIPAEGHPSVASVSQPSKPRLLPHTLQCPRQPRILFRFLTSRAPRAYGKPQRGDMIIAQGIALGTLIIRSCKTQLQTRLSHIN